MSISEPVQSLSSAKLAAYLQSTLVRPDATRDQIIAHVETCAEYGFNAAMIPMYWVPLARQILQGTDIRVATAICFGLGNESVYAKVALLRECRALGADEVDYQPNMSLLLSGMEDEFHDEAAEMVRAAGDMTLKAMLELGYIDTEDGQRRAARLLEEAGVPWIKNSSGAGPHLAPATPENIRLLRQTLKPTTHVKASGGIKSYAQSVALIEAGAELLGTSAAVEIVHGAAASASDY